MVTLSAGNSRRVSMEIPPFVKVAIFKMMRHRYDRSGSKVGFFQKKVPFQEEHIAMISTSLLVVFRSSSLVVV